MILSTARRRRRRLARPRTQRNGRGHLNQINEDVRKHHLDRIRGPAHSLGVFHRRTDTIGLKGVLKDLLYRSGRHINVAKKL